MLLRTLHHNTSGVWTNLQACFPNIALLKSIKSLKSRPPQSFLLFRSSHFFQCIPLLAALCFHQKEAIRCSIVRQMDAGILNIDIAYWGRAWITVLIRTSFPAFEINLSFHHSNFRSTLVRIHANICFLGWSQSDGIPKYLSVLSLIGTLNSAARFCFRLYGQSLPVNSPDLFRFIACPDT